MSTYKRRFMIFSVLGIALFAVTLMATPVISKAAAKTYEYVISSTSANGGSTTGIGSRNIFFVGEEIRLNFYASTGTKGSIENSIYRYDKGMKGELLVTEVYPSKPAIVQGHTFTRKTVADLPGDYLAEVTLYSSDGDVLSTMSRTYTLIRQPSSKVAREGYDDGVTFDLGADLPAGAAVQWYYTTSNSSTGTAIKDQTKSTMTLRFFDETLTRNMNNRYIYCIITYESTRGTTTSKSTLTSGKVKLYVQYATWTPMLYHITYDLTGGYNGPDDESCEINTSYVINVIEPSRKGYVFAGWTTDSTSYTGTYKGGTSLTIRDDITISATWTALSYTVSFDPNGGKASTVPSDITVYTGDSVRIDTARPENSDNILQFVGWATNPATSPADTDSMYMPGDFISTDEDITLYAIWRDKRQDTVIYPDKTNMRLSIGASNSISITTNNDGKLDCRSSNNRVVSAYCSGDIVKIHAVGYGKATITVTADETENFFAESTSVTVTVIPKKMSKPKIKGLKKNKKKKTLWFKKVTWSKVSGVDHYVVRVTTVNGNLKDVSTKTNSLTKIGGKKLSKKRALKKKVSIRVKAVAPGGLEGAWSSAKTIKV